MFTLIKAALAAQSDTEIAYGSIRVSETQDFVLLRAVTARSKFSDAVGAQRMAEYLDLDILISCDRGGDDFINGVPTQQIASERAWALLALIETRLRTDVTLTGLVYWTFRSSAREVETNPDDSFAGRFSEVTATFTAETKI
jgi:hypothetical protein